MISIASTGKRFGNKGRVVINDNTFAVVKSRIFEVGAGNINRALKDLMIAGRNGQPDSPKGIRELYIVEHAT